MVSCLWGGESGAGSGSWARAPLPSSHVSARSIPFSARFPPPPPLSHRLCPAGLPPATRPRPPLFTFRSTRSRTPCPHRKIATHAPFLHSSCLPKPTRAPPPPPPSQTTKNRTPAILLPFYEGFVAGFAHRMSPLRLAHVAGAVAAAQPGPDESGEKRRRRGRGMRAVMDDGEGRDGWGGGGASPASPSLRRHAPPSPLTLSKSPSWTRWPPPSRPARAARPPRPTRRAPACTWRPWRPATAWRAGTSPPPGEACGPRRRPWRPCASRTRRWRRPSTGRRRSWPR